jgi:hypothetical protein
MSSAGKIRMIITHDNIKKADRSEYQWQQWSIMRRLRQVNLNVMVMGMRNRLWKRRGSIGKNLTGCLQRYVFLQYERMIKYLILNTNNIVLQIIPRENNFDSHRRPREMCRTNSTRFDSPACRHLLAWITYPWNN